MGGDQVPIKPFEPSSQNRSSLCAGVWAQELVSARVDYPGLRFHVAPHVPEDRGTGTPPPEIGFFLPLMESGFFPAGQLGKTPWVISVLSGFQKGGVGPPGGKGAMVEE